MRYCPKCNYAITNDNALFCKKCGANLSGSKPTQPLSPSGVTMAPPSAKEKPDKPVVQPNVKRDQPVKSEPARPQPQPQPQHRRVNPHPGMIDAVVTCFENYANFKGRAPRKEFWYFPLFNLIVAVLVYIIGAILALGFKKVDEGIIALIVGAIYLVVAICPYLAVFTRRLHDVGKSGWLWLVTFIPVAGIIILLVYLCRKGEPTVNKYGIPPGA